MCYVHDAILKTSSVEMVCNYVLENFDSNHPNSVNAHQICSPAITN